MSECSLCNGTGWRPVERNGWRAVEVCSCRRQPRDEPWWMEQARIPRGFWEAGPDEPKDFDHFYSLGNPSLQIALVKARGFADRYPMVERGLFLLGNPGVGKTHLTVAILKQLMTQKGVECLFCSFTELLEQILDSYDPISLKTKYEIVQPILETEVVAIDDFAARRMSDWAEGVLKNEEGITR